MDKNYPEITRQTSANMRKLRNDIPDTMKGFAALAHDFESVFKRHHVGGGEGGEFAERQTGGGLELK